MSYSKVEQDSSQSSRSSDDINSQQHLLAEQHDGLYFTGRPKPRDRLFTLLSVIVPLLTLAVGVFIGTLLVDRDRAATLRTSLDSPILNDVSLTYTNTRYNGSLFKETIYRRDPSPEVDDAWKALGVDYNSVRVPEKDARQARLLPDQVKINRKYGGGYPANVEGLHHLHCLNLLRKTMYWNYDYYLAKGEGPFSNNAKVLKSHTTHCMDVIRQQLMCTVDVGLLGQVWRHPDDPRATVDFNTEHKCRNYEAVRAWAETHQLPDRDDIPGDFLELPKEGDRIYDVFP